MQPEQGNPEQSVEGLQWVMTRNALIEQMFSDPAPKADMPRAHSQR
jgi:hypothetical protein